MRFGDPYPEGFHCLLDFRRCLMTSGNTVVHAEGSLPLPWSIRMKIALGAAKGLAFLHGGAERPVIYRDFKTSNILLDSEYNAKLSDFGLAKDGPEGDKTHVSTRVMGTYGYAAPEPTILKRHASTKLINSYHRKFYESGLDANLEASLLPLLVYQVYPLSQLDLLILKAPGPLVIVELLAAGILFRFIYGTVVFDSSNRCDVDGNPFLVLCLLERVATPCLLAFGLQEALGVRRNKDRKMEFRVRGIRQQGKWMQKGGSMCMVRQFGELMQLHCGMRMHDICNLTGWSNSNKRRKNPALKENPASELADSSRSIEKVQHSKKDFSSSVWTLQTTDVLTFYGNLPVPSRCEYPANKADAFKYGEHLDELSSAFWHPLASAFFQLEVCLVKVSMAFVEPDQFWGCSSYAADIKDEILDLLAMNSIPVKSPLFHKEDSPECIVSNVLSSGTQGKPLLACNHEIDCKMSHPRTPWSPMFLRILQRIATPSSSMEYVGHLTSRSDVYSFGVVLLEMLTGRRSMDKNRPSGEHNLVEWARPYLGEKRRLYRLIDPRLEGHFSIKGAHKAAQLAHHCLSRDPKARPLMSDVVDVLRPLLNLKDMASSSFHYQAFQAERTSRHQHMANGQVKNLANGNGSLSSKNGHPRAIINGSHVSPYRQSPRQNGKEA
eukprot:Gb_40104 [translate_table: standard]